MSEAPKTLVKKLAAVMAAVSHVPKGGKNKEQGYEFARDVDVLAAVRKELAARNVFLTNAAEETGRGHVETKSGSKMEAVSVRMTFTAHDGDSGESLPFSVGLGEARDSGDKAVYKAQTGATKYAILKGFLIPTGDDPEADEEVDRAASDSGATIPAPQRMKAQAPVPAKSDLPTTFPNFGNQKGQPIAEADARTLLFYLGASKRTLEDPEKSRFHAKERSYVAAYEASLLRLKNGQPQDAGYEADAPF